MKDFLKLFDSCESTFEYSSSDGELWRSLCLENSSFNSLGRAFCCKASCFARLDISFEGVWFLRSL
jgi:hypothetical protein